MVTVKVGVLIIKHLAWTQTVITTNLLYLLNFSHSIPAPHIQVTWVLLHETKTDSHLSLYPL
jgi:hypothetical protein